MQTSLKHLKSRGFTIVELLIVIVVIGILAALSIVAYNGVQAKAIDKSAQSDADSLDGFEARYATANNTSGKSWYSKSGVDSDLQFAPSSGNVVDIVTGSSGYCIRVYNPNSASFKSLATATLKESTPGICASLYPSSNAIADSPLPPPPANGGSVTTLAGSAAGTSGYADGAGTAAKFYYPEGLALDSSGNIYVADSSNGSIREVTTAGVVTTFAGNGTQGYTDGTGSAARFIYPRGIAIDASGNLFVADALENNIRKITPSGVVTTFAGSTSGASGYVDATGTAARFDGPVGITIDASGTIYVGDINNDNIRKITPSGVVTTFAGSTSGASGYVDATGTAARFNFPWSLTTDSSGNLFVADRLNNSIRKITPAGVVTTFAGSTSGTSGNVNATGTAARFNNPMSIANDASGNFYVADLNNQNIRKITSSGAVTTLAGSTSGVSGYQDGTTTAARFSYPSGIVVNKNTGVIYVSDNSNNAIRVIR